MTKEQATKKKKSALWKGKMTILVLLAMPLKWSFSKDSTVSRPMRLERWPVFFLAKILVHWMEVNPSLTSQSFPQEKGLEGSYSLYSSPEKALGALTCWRREDRDKEGMNLTSKMFTHTPILHRVCAFSLHLHAVFKQNGSILLDLLPKS